ncbi:MAG: hypothetical protein IIA06_03790 [Proteobacteria bacterium]|nr:hypothetical protein [Pseudomonadota bacterium]
MNLTKHDVLCLDILGSIPNKRSKHCFRSAINHLELGEKLLPIDKPMGVFRLLTAEEEAASGLMFCLKDHGYMKANRLNPRDHNHKVSVIELFRIIKRFIVDEIASRGIDIDIVTLQEQDGIRLALNIVLPGEDKEQRPKIRPYPPLCFNFSGQEINMDYKKQIESLLAERGIEDIKKYVKCQANRRNQLLYASNKGYPANIEIEDKFYPAQKSRVFAMLNTYLLIEPYSENSQFVQDSLNAYLNIFTKIGLKKSLWECIKNCFFKKK